MSGKLVNKKHFEFSSIDLLLVNINSTMNWIFSINLLLFCASLTDYSPIIFVDRILPWQGQTWQILGNIKQLGLQTRRLCTFGLHYIKHFVKVTTVEIKMC